MRENLERMDEQEILRLVEAAQAKLDELRVRQSPSSAKSSQADDEEGQRQEDLQRIRGFRLIDDVFLNACLDGYNEGAELMLRIILGKPDLHVKSVRTQLRIKNLLGRDVILDIEADDDSGKKYNIEVQRADKGADKKRARYHSAILDTHMLQPGQDFKDLPENYVVFVTEDDVLGGGLPPYAVERQITNLGCPFDDGEHIVYVNGADKDASTELGRLMHDLNCSDPDDMNYRELADKVRYFKEDEEGVAVMCKVLEDMRNEAAKSAVEKERKTNALIMLADGLSVEKAAKYSQLPVDRVRELAAQMVAQ